MEIKPIIKKSKNGETICFFHLSKEDALEVLKKSDTHNFTFHIEDPREKTHAQIKLFWGMLNEFVKYKFPNQKLGKDEMDKLKLALYDEYKAVEGVRIELSKTNVENARLFLTWLIRRYADVYGFVSKNIMLQNEFNDGYVYSTLVTNTCSICGGFGEVVEYKKKVLSLCEKHNKLTRKQLNEDYHIEPIEISEKLKEFLKEV